MNIAYNGTIGCKLILNEVIGIFVCVVGKDNRIKGVTFRVTESEYAIIVRATDLAERGMADFCRRAVLKVAGQDVSEAEAPPKKLKREK
jgi:hypothetical protein